MCLIYLLDGDNINFNTHNFYSGIVKQAFNKKTPHGIKFTPKVLLRTIIT